MKAYLEPNEIEELLKEREGQLEETQTNVQLLVHTMAEGVILVDSSGHIQFTTRLPQESSISLKEIS